MFQQWLSFSTPTFAHWISSWSLLMCNVVQSRSFSQQMRVGNFAPIWERSERVEFTPSTGGLALLVDSHHAIRSKKLLGCCSDPSAANTTESLGRVSMQHLKNLLSPWHSFYSWRPSQGPPRQSWEKTSWNHARDYENRFSLSLSVHGAVRSFHKMLLQRHCHVRCTIPRSLPTIRQKWLHC